MITEFRKASARQLKIIGTRQNPTATSKSPENPIAGCALLHLQNDQKRLELRAYRFQFNNLRKHVSCDFGLFTPKKKTLSL